jgi:hypothetical protein
VFSPFLRSPTIWALVLQQKMGIFLKSKFFLIYRFLGHFFHGGAKKLKIAGKKCKSSAKPELAILKVNWACARTVGWRAHTHWGALGEPTSSHIRDLELCSRREAFKTIFNEEML